jgi:hypothetical protein
MEVGTGLDSCTTTVASTIPFLIDNDKVVLIDTPGFDNNIEKDLDSVLSDVKAHITMKYVLWLMALWILFYLHTQIRGE